MTMKTTVKCKNCKTEFEARVADRKRGWARFCSKSCKAKKQSKTMPFDKDAQRSYKKDNRGAYIEGMNYIDPNDVDDDEHLGNLSIDRDWQWTTH